MSDINMEIDHDPSTVLTTLRLEADESLQHYFYQFEDCFERKLYHQLTELLTEFYSDPASKGIRLRLYNRFITFFSAKINQIKLIDFLILSIEECNEEDGLSYLNNLKDKISSMELEYESYLYVTFQISLKYLKLGDSDKTNDILIEYGKNIDEQDLNNNKINSIYYYTLSELYKLKSDYTGYYKTIFKYLACIELDSLSEEAKESIGYELVISALLGDKIYNFGELILHDIVHSIPTSYKWLFELIQALNNGDLKSFNALLVNLSQIKTLKDNESFLRQKICIMSLIELISTKDSNRNLTFGEISAVTGLPIDDVEHLIMKALSLGLIKGYINQVDGILIVKWIHPRILNLNQIENLHKKLVNWDEGVVKLSSEMYSEGNAIYGA